MRSIVAIEINVADGTTNPMSLAIETDQWYAFSVQAIGTGSIAGTMKVQVSNDPGSNLGVNTPTNWIDLPMASVALSSLIGLIPKTDCSYNWIRIVFTSSGGAGAFKAQIKGCAF